MTPADVVAANLPPVSEDDVVIVKALRKKYREFEAVHGVDFSIRRGEIFGLIGPDGAGKTTIFHIMGGVMEPTDGTVIVVGRQPRDARLDIGYLTQKFSLPQDLSIDENLRY